MTTYTGTWPLVRVALRRDRVIASVWVLLLVVVVYASAAATESLYPTVADRVTAAEAINNSAAIVALYGPILDVTSLGELAMTKLTVLYAVFVALLFLVLVRRHTRTEEESGRAELLGGTAVGRDAQLAEARHVEDRPVQRDDRGAVVDRLSGGDAVGDGGVQALGRRGRRVHDHDQQQRPDRRDDPVAPQRRPGEPPGAGVRRHETTAAWLAAWGR